MASLAFFAHFLLGIGPGIIFFLIVIAPKSFLVLLTFTSAFYWLFVLLITAAIFRGFLPVSYALGPYAGMLVGIVALQELARFALWKAHESTCRVLTQHARAMGHRFDIIDKLYLALGWGYGHGAAHVIFMVLSFLPLTVGNGTWYLYSCPAMSIFLGGALNALAFGMLLPSLMVVAFEGYQEGHWHHVVYAPLMHLGAALLTLLNFQHNGCKASMPLLLILGAGNVAYAGLVCWRKGAHQLPLPPHLGPRRDLQVDDEVDTDEPGSHTELYDAAAEQSSTVGASVRPARRRVAKATAPLLSLD